MAYSMPSIAEAIRASVRNRSWASNLPASSWSKPRIMPHHTSIPARWMRRTRSRSVPAGRTFWNFRVSRSNPSFGLSMPTKTLTMLASTIRPISSRSSAKSRDASVKKAKG